MKDVLEIAKIFGNSKFPEFDKNEPTDEKYFYSILKDIDLDKLNVLALVIENDLVNAYPSLKIEISRILIQAVKKELIDVSFQVDDSDFGVDEKGNITIGNISL